MWKVVETKVGKVGITETERGIEKRRRRKKARRKKRKKGKETQKDGSMEDSRRVGDLR